MAAAHALLALPLLAWNSSVRLATGNASHTSSEGVVYAAMLQEADRSGDVAMSMGPCGTKLVGQRLAADERLISSANLPASVLAGWFDPCPARWTISAVLDPARRFSRAIAAQLVAAYTLLIGVEWFLVGSFPLVQPVRWWREPGAVITTCFIAGSLPLLLLDAVGFYQWRSSGAYAPLVASTAVAVVADSMAVLMVLSWSAWGLLIVSRTLMRLSRAVARREVPESRNPGLARASKRT